MSKDKRTKAGKLLSKFVKEIADEETELVHDPETGGDRMATKAEALARYMWKAALGFTEEEEVYKEGKKVGIKSIKKKPDKTFITMIWDRLEGRVIPTADKDKDNKATIADRISEQGKIRLNAMNE